MLQDTTFPVQATIDWTHSRPVGAGEVLICAINLDRSPDRWDAINEQLAASDLPYLRLSAYDGSTLPPVLQATVDHAHFEKANGRKVTPGDVGCYLSHVAAWTVLDQQPQHYLLVVEDDAVFEAGWTDTLRQALRTHQPGTMLKLSWQRKGVVRTMDRIDAEHQLVRPLTHQACNAAYLIDAQAAQHLLRGAFPINVPVDHYVESPWMTDVPVRSIIPPLAHQRGVASTITKQKKFHWSKRWPTLVYRLKAHTLRMWHSYFTMA